MRSRSLFQFIQLDDADTAVEKTALSTQEPSAITMLPTELLRCNGSSNIDRIGYRDRQATLEIHFHSGGHYQYFDVPRFVFDGMLGADSVGKYFHRCIKGFFTSRKL